MNSPLNQNTLKTYLHQLLNVDAFKDYCPNGLQVAHGNDNNNDKVIKKIISGVTINQELIEQAIEQKADALLVHHGLFWKGDSPCVQGLLYQRLQALIKNDIALFAYHLPLDAHLIYGNNAQLGKKFNLSSDAFAGEQNLIHLHHAPNALSTLNLLQTIEKNLQQIYLDPAAKNFNKENLNLNLNITLTPPLQYIDQHGHAFGLEGLNDSQKNRNFKTIAWCSGGAQSYFMDAIAAGADVFITGEISEQYVHMACETGVAYIAAGHHATERFAVQALGAHLAEHFHIEHVYVDVLSLV